MMVLDIVILLLLFGGGWACYSHRGAHYGRGGMGLIGIIVLLAFALLTLGR